MGGGLRVYEFGFVSKVVCYKIHTIYDYKNRLHKVENIL